MMPQGPSDDLQDVLDAYLSAVETPSHAALSAWIARYPQFSQELIAFTAAWSLTETLPPTPAVQALAVEVDDLATRSLSRMRAAQTPMAAAAPTIESLSAVGTARGLSLDQLAAQTGLSLVLLRLFDRRLIRFASIPRQAIEAIAAAIGRDVEGVTRYLQGAPTLAPGASYRAEQTPQLGEQEEFFDAVRDDPDLTADQVAYWLALEPPRD